jgi:thiamine kinase-like enzyme
MLDLDWERSAPILDLGIDEMKKIFAEYDRALIITNFKIIQIGCKNSNYIVSADAGKYLLRITRRNDFSNEKAVFALLKDKINVPDLLFNAANDKINIFIYQYIYGDSLQKRIIESNECEYSLLEQVAEAAAVIHGIPQENASKLAALDVPPIEMWYEVFLNNPIVRQRLNDGIHKRIRKLIIDKQEFIPAIKRYRSLVHSDFRPANMIVDKHNQVYFVDWESAWRGYALVDIGQFFRYIQFFDDSHINLFKNTYSACANRDIPDNWFELSLFIDLVNLLQLLSIKQDAPLRNADLLNIINKKLEYFNY